MKGTCLCGAIEVIADAKNEVSLCHCSMCRKWSSGALHAVHCGPNGGPSQSVINRLTGR